MNRVAIVGASRKESRYSNMAQRLLMDLGYPVVPISPFGEEILGVGGYRTLSKCPYPVDTVTLYIGSVRVPTVLDDLLEKRPRRVVFNPGTENEAIRQELEREGIETLEACTLVLLRTGLF